MTESPAELATAWSGGSEPGENQSRALLDELDIPTPSAISPERSDR